MWANMWVHYQFSLMVYVTKGTISISKILNNKQKKIGLYTAKKVVFTYKKTAEL